MTALSRRNLLRAIAAVAGTGASGVSPKAALAAASVAAVDVPSTPMPIDPWGYGPKAPDIWDASRGVRAALHKASARIHHPVPLTASVRSKRSWSDSYKETVVRQEAERIAAALDALEDEGSARAILRALGIEVPA